jgi:hypothetical protein
MDIRVFDYSGILYFLGLKVNTESIKMRNFKFFQSPVAPTPTQLRRYHKRLLSRYTYRFNLYPGQPNYNAGGLISDTTISFINQHQLTSYGEVRSYYRLNYEYLLGDEIDVITDEEHDEIIRSVEDNEVNVVDTFNFMGRLFESAQSLQSEIDRLQESMNRQNSV